MLSLLFKFISPDMIKYIAYIVIAVVIFIILWVLFSTIKENGEKDSIIESQSVIIETQRQTIVRTELINNLKDQHIAIRDQELKVLEETLENVTVDLGEDSKDQAPKSIKELFRRLNK
jgi:uncharacterized membrane protein YhiD involved in acid resistance